MNLRFFQPSRSHRSGRVFFFGKCLVIYISLWRNLKEASQPLHDPPTTIHQFDLNFWPEMVKVSLTLSLSLAMCLSESAKSFHTSPRFWDLRPSISFFFLSLTLAYLSCTHGRISDSDVIHSSLASPGDRISFFLRFGRIWMVQKHLF